MNRTFALACVSVPLAAAAAPNEIKIFSDELAGYGERSIEYHVNKASKRGPASSAPAPLQLMPEYSYGMRKNWELSVQLPLAEERGRVRADGARVELQFVAPHDPDAGAYWGFNLEAAYRAPNEEPRFWNIELIPIAGWRSDRWHFIVNPGVSRRISGNDRSADFEPAAKATYRVGENSRIGAEYFVAAGPLRRWLPKQQRSQVLYAVWDGRIGSAEVNIGLGHGSTDASDRWVFKAIVEFSFD